MRKSAWILAGAVALAGCSIGQDVPLAEAEATNFHKLLDAGKFDAIWQGASADLTSSPKANFEKLLDAVHRKLGAFKGAQQQGWNDQATTSGHFITLTYQSHYEKGDAAENFVYRIDGGKAHLAGYHINSDALIYN